MKQHALLGLEFLLLSFTASGQSTMTILKDNYPRAPDGAFTVKPGVKIKAVNGATSQACVLIVSGPVTEPELMKTFDTCVPPKSRGAKKQDLIECAGGCERFLEFESVSFQSGVIGGEQTSEPAALIIFKRKDCEAAAQQAGKTSFSLNIAKH